VTEPQQQKRILVAHLIYALRTGGLENILVTLINELPAERFRHVVFCLTTYDEEYRRTQIRQPDCEVIALHKRPGTDLGMLWRLAGRLRRLKPDVFHSHNLGPMEGQWAAALAGVPRRVHTEHGRDTYDLDGTNWKYNLFRRATRPLIHQYTAVSKDLAKWLVETVGVRPERVKQIYTGIDTERFCPGGPKLREIEGAPAGFFDEGTFVIGTVGRLAEVKDQGTLIEAFARLRPQENPRPLRLMIVGEGAMRGKLEGLIGKHQLEAFVWLTGNRTDIPQLLRQMDLYALPSTVEGISISILEAMATGLPVVATGVGGNPEIVTEGETGVLVPVGDVGRLAEAIGGLAGDPVRLRGMGVAGREYVVRECELESYYGAYESAYLGVKS
jgi:sugar transferase (PEP-CTERM/EpsH1 system associated)